MQFGGEGVHHADGWRGFLVAFSAAGVTVAQKLIMDVHFHGAVTQTGLHGPVIQRPVSLYVRVEAAGGVDFIANQCAFDAQLVADKILIAVAAVLALVIVQAANQSQVTRYALNGLHPTQATAVELSVELDDPSALFVTGSCRWNRQILNHTPRAGIRIDLQGRVTDVAFVVHAQLLVVDAFAGVVDQRVGRHRARVGLIRFPTLPQRILGTVLLKAAVNQCQFAVFVGLEVELGKGLVAARGAVLAVTIGVHTRSVEYKAHVINRTFSRQVVFAHAVAAHQGFGANTRRTFAVTREHLDHATRVAAV